MPDLVWVSLVSLGPMVLILVGLGLFFRFRPLHKPYLRTVGRVVDGVSALGLVPIEFADFTGRTREVSVFHLGRGLRAGQVVSVVYHGDRPTEAMIYGPGSDGTILFALAGVLALVGTTIVIVTTDTGSS